MTEVILSLEDKKAIEKLIAQAEENIEKNQKEITCFILV